MDKIMVTEIPTTLDIIEKNQQVLKGVVAASVLLQTIVDKDPLTAQHFGIDEALAELRYSESKLNSQLASNMEFARIEIDGNQNETT
jgi:hypothetical protein